MKTLNILIITLFSSMTLSAQNTCKLSELFYDKGIKLPQSFEKYKHHVLDEHCFMPVFLSPELNKSVKVKKKDKQRYATKLTFKLLGKKVSVSYKEGDGGDSNFVIDYENKSHMLTGETLFISHAGYLYLQGRGNYDYDIRKKFKLTSKGVEEVKQSAYLVNLECKLSKDTILYEKKDAKGDIVAKLPKGKSVKVLLHDNSKKEDSLIGQYLISTPFGLVGWVSSTSGYMQTGGKPLDCLLYIGA